LTLEDRLRQILVSDPWFMGIIVAVGSLHLPDWAVAAGVIRNVVWDHLHEYTQRTPVADVDVPYFDPTDLAPEREEVPSSNWAGWCPRCTGTSRIKPPSICGTHGGSACASLPLHPSRTPLPTTQKPVFA